MERDQDFWISVCCEFEVKEQLTSLIRVLQYLMTLPQDSEEGERASSEVQPSSILIPNHLYYALHDFDMRHYMRFYSISLQILRKGVLEEEVRSKRKRQSLI